LPANPASVEERFYQRAKEYLMGHNRLAGGLMGDRKLYQWNTSTNRLESFLVSSATASRLAAAERAADLYEISPSSDRNRKLYLITQLEAAKRVAGSNRSVDVKSLLNKFPNANASEIDQANPGLDRVLRNPVRDWFSRTCHGHGQQPTTAGKSIVVGRSSLAVRGV
jgi:hypothetical protein